MRIGKKTLLQTKNSRNGGGTKKTHNIISFPEEKHGVPTPLSATPAAGFHRRGEGDGGWCEWCD